MGFNNQLGPPGGPCDPNVGPCDEGPGGTCRPPQNMDFNNGQFGANSHINDGMVGGPSQGDFSQDCCPPPMNMESYEDEMRPVNHYENNAGYIESAKNQYNRNSSNNYNNQNSNCSNSNNHHPNSYQKHHNGVFPKNRMNPEQVSPSELSPQHDHHHRSGKQQRGTKSEGRQQPSQSR